MSPQFMHRNLLSKELLFVAIMACANMLFYSVQWWLSVFWYVPSNPPGFLRKVYGILSAQLGLTILIGALFMYTPTIKGFVQQR